VTLVARGVTKAFGATKALAGVDLEAPAGEITAVIGQNGAGKSTLMGVLAGAVVPDGGVITLDGAPFSPSSPRAARLAGVAMVHQELSLCPHLSVTENVLLGALPTRRGLVDWPRAHAVAREALAPLAGAAIDPRAKVSDLSIANQQLVEIARALSGEKCRVLILDEPTSSLGTRDTERLFARLRELRTRALVILYLSHFLEEVKALADGFVVVRDGKSVGAGKASDASIDEMIEMMAGRRVETLYARSERSPKDVVLSVEGLGEKLEVRRGEIVGLAGLLGAGRTELLRSIFGLDPPRGSARVSGVVAMTSEDRKAEGLAMSLSVAANVTLGGPRGLFVTEKSDELATAPWIERLGIRGSARSRVSDLSGGNQQKVALARILHHGADLLLVDEPTRGIDVEAKAQIYALLDRAAKDGKAVLLVSSYIPELLGICDRVHVMRRSALGPSHDAKSIDEHAVLREAVQ
jgi:ribose transport system ATP-binding protein